MLRTLVALCAIAFPPVSAAARAPQAQPAPGQEIVFDVFRGDSRFGEHRVSFSRDAGQLVVDITIRLRAGLGPITVFRYEHDASERWRDGALLSLEARTLKDGREYEVSANRENDALIVESRIEDQGAGVDRMPPGISPSSHWRRYAEDTERMLSTETGQPLPAEVRYLGVERIRGDAGWIDAHRYRIESELTLDLWYDENGHWAGCAFDARGQSIRYVRRADPLRSG